MEKETIMRVVDCRLHSVPFSFAGVCKYSHSKACHGRHILLILLVHICRGDCVLGVAARIRCVVKKRPRNDLYAPSKCTRRASAKASNPPSSPQSLPDPCPSPHY